MRKPMFLLLLLFGAMLTLSGCSRALVENMPFNRDLAEEAATLERLPVALANVNFEAPPDYWELRSEFFEALQLDSGGPLAFADLPAAVQEELRTTSLADGFGGMDFCLSRPTTFLVTVTDGEIEYVNWAGRVRELLGPIDNAADALMLLIAEGYSSVRRPELVGESAEGYQFLVQRELLRNIACILDRPALQSVELLTVSPDGSIVAQARATSMVRD